ncbi:hypothetical protein ACFE04_023504 [Oxalis oulophora]
MNPVKIKDQVSPTNDDIISPGSSTTQEHNSGIDNFQDLTSRGMMKLEEPASEYESVKKMFFSGLGPFAKDTDVVAVHKTLKSDDSSAIKARWDSFTGFSDSVAKCREGDANVVFAWYGGSRNEISRIISQGFTLGFRPTSVVSYGVGVCLYSSKHSLYGMESADYDRVGVRHMLLCRVILGNAEVIQPGSDQFQPSSDKFDSGVDDLTDPNRYIVWSRFMNSQIFPHYVVSFKATSSMSSNRSGQSHSFKQGPCRTTASVLRRFLNLPRISFSDFLAIISECLIPSKMTLISKQYSEYRANKISREQMVQALRQIFGDRVLIHIIKAHKEWPSDFESLEFSIRRCCDRITIVESSVHQRSPDTETGILRLV